MTGEEVYPSAAQQHHYVLVTNVSNSVVKHILYCKWCGNIIKLNYEFTRILIS